MSPHPSLPAGGHCVIQWKPGGVDSPGLSPVPCVPATPPSPGHGCPTGLSHTLRLTPCWLQNFHLHVPTTALRLQQFSLTWVITSDRRRPTVCLAGCVLRSEMPRSAHTVPSRMGTISSHRTVTDRSVKIHSRCRHAKRGASFPVIFPPVCHSI